MNFAFITSSDNKSFKHIQKLNSKAYRDKCKQFYAEGSRIALEAVTFAKEYISSVWLSESFNNIEIKKILDDLKCNIYTVSDKLFLDLCGTKTPQGIIVVLDKPRVTNFDFTGRNHILILDSISEPGNMGTIIRTADAFGFDTILLTKGCTDIYSPKVVRSTMGAIFRTNFLYDCDYRSAIDMLKNRNYSIISSALHPDSHDIKNIKPVEKFALVIGNEALGVSDEILKESDITVKIHMEEYAESLNAAVAAGILMYSLKNKN